MFPSNRTTYLLAFPFSTTVKVLLALLTISSVLSSPALGANPETREKGLSVDSLHWEQVTGHGRRALIANLKENGVPNEAISIIVWAEVQRERLEIRFPVTVSESAEFYWEQSTRHAQYSEGEWHVAELNQEVDRLLREALGYDYNQTQRPSMERKYGFLSPRKYEAAVKIEYYFRNRKHEIEQKTRLYRMKEDGEELSRLEVEEREALETLLMPEELWEHDLRNSALAARVRSSLRFMEPTEHEFRHIYAVHYAHEGAVDTRQRMSSQERRQWMEAQNRAQEQVWETYGPEWTRRQQLSHSPYFGQLVSLTNRLQLPRKRAFEVAGLREMAEQERQEIEADDTLSQEEKDAALQLLMEKVLEQGREALGRTGYEAYRRGGDSWIRDLEQS